MAGLRMKLQEMSWWAWNNSVGLGVSLGHLEWYGRLLLGQRNSGVMGDGSDGLKQLR